MKLIQPPHAFFLMLKPPQHLGTLRHVNQIHLEANLT